MSLKDLIRAALSLESARQRVDELKAERNRLNGRLVDITIELAAARADADAAIVTIKAEAPTVAGP
jgi:predicted  nucleic acid-binding Zn-ribbon protein